MEPIILASSSPRRQEILKLLNIPFKVIIPNIDETISSAIEPEEIPEFLAREKVTAAIYNKTAIRPNTRVDSGFLLAFAYNLFTDFCYFLSS